MAFILERCCSRRTMEVITKVQRSGWMPALQRLLLVVYTDWSRRCAGSTKETTAASEGKVFFNFLFFQQSMEVHIVVSIRVQFLRAAYPPAYKPLTSFLQGLCSFPLVGGPMMRKMYICTKGTTARGTMAVGVGAMGYRDLLHYNICGSFPLNFGLIYNETCSPKKHTRVCMYFIQLIIKQRTNYDLCTLL